MFIWGIFGQKTLLVEQVFARQPDMLWLWKTRSTHDFQAGSWRRKI